MPRPEPAGWPHQVSSTPRTSSGQSRKKVRNHKKTRPGACARTQRPKVVMSLGVWKGLDVVQSFPVSLVATMVVCHKNVFVCKMLVHTTWSAGLRCCCALRCSDLRPRPETRQGPRPTTRKPQPSSQNGFRARTLACALRTIYTYLHGRRYLQK